MTVIHVDLEARRRAAERIVAEVTDRLSCSRGNTWLKQWIIDRYCDGEIDQETAMRLIREMGLKHA